MAQAPMCLARPTERPSAHIAMQSTAQTTSGVVQLPEDS